MKEESQELIQSEKENEQMFMKKMRLEIEPTTSRPNDKIESSQKETSKEMFIRNDDIVKTFEREVPMKSGEIVTRSSSDGIVSSSETVDDNKEETYFALSLVGILKRLPPNKRAHAKCHILSYLTELEYGSSSIS